MRSRALLRERAKKDVDSILDYLHAKSPSAEARFWERLEDARDLLARMPLIGRTARSPRMLRKGYRCFVLDDYVLFYKVETGVVRIWRVLHGRQKPPAEDNDNAAPR